MDLPVMASRELAEHRWDCALITGLSMDLTDRPRP
jgi:hypothetical protein